MLRNPLKLKQLQKGLRQLAKEGAAQLFRPVVSNHMILGAVGTLRFDVVAHRLEHEYGADAVFEPYPVATARWLRGSDKTLFALCCMKTDVDRSSAVNDTRFVNIKPCLLTRAGVLSSASRAMKAWTLSGGTP